MELYYEVEIHLLSFQPVIVWVKKQKSQYCQVSASRPEKEVSYHIFNHISLVLHGSEKWTVYNACIKQVNYLFAFRNKQNHKINCALCNLCQGNSTMLVLWATRFILISLIWLFFFNVYLIHIVWIVFVLIF